MRLAQDPSTVEDVLRSGAQKACAEAQQTMALVREAVGMKPRNVGVSAGVSAGVRNRFPLTLRAAFFPKPESANRYPRQLA